jgi:hypothetical protein
MWFFSSIKRILSSAFPDPRENSELLEEIKIHSKGEFSMTGEYYLTIECRRNQNGNFGIVTISQGDGVSRYYLNKKEFETLTASLSKYCSS